MLCLEWALHRGQSRLDGSQQGPDIGDPRAFASFDAVWQAFLAQLDAMVGRVVRRVVETLDDRHTIAPVPLLSALIEGCIASRRDLTAGGAKYRTFGMLAEGAAHAIDSLTAIKTVIFAEKQASMAELCDALDANFTGYVPLRAKLLAAPQYGNDDDRADAVGRAVIEAFVSYAKMHDGNLPAGGPLDLRLARRLVEGDEGTARMAALIRSFVDTGGNMMTLTVADTEELRAAQREPEKYQSLRVRMGGWCAYFTMLSREQQEHDLVLYDLKLIDEEAHRRWTGASNRPILRNAARLAGYNVQVRVPLIPGITDTEENLQGIFAFMRAVGLPSAALLPYNPSAPAEYEWLGQPYDLPGEPQSRDQLAGFVELARQAGIEAVIG